MTMGRWQATIIDSRGNVVPAASVEVRREAAGLPLAAVYSDRDGTVPLGNPFLASSSGFAAFYAAGGMYRITATFGDQSIVWRDVAIGLAAAVDTSDGLLASLGMATRTQFTDRWVHPDVDKLYVVGYATVGDAPPAVYVAAASEPSHPGKLQTSNGRWFELSNKQAIHLEHFGGHAYTQAELVALNGHASIDAVATANVAAHAAANAFLKYHGGGLCRHDGQIYVINGPCRRGSSVHFEGAGTDEWDPVYPGSPKLWGGTTFLCKGTFTRNVTFPGITSMENEGGWVEDPDNPGTDIKLWTAYNRNASGTTPATLRQFSVAFMPEDNNVKYGGFRNFRIVNWIGTNGISDWSNTGSTSLGADIDFGHVLRNNSYARDSGLQVVGGWREFAHWMGLTGDLEGTSERNFISHCKFQGRVGRGLRGPDRRWITTTPTWNGSAGTVTIKWSLENPFPASGTFRGSDNALYTYTGVTHAGTDPDWVFTGVTPDPSGLFHIRFANTGFAGSIYVDCQSYDIAHQSGASAATLGLGAQTKVFEVSGFPMRGIKTLNSKEHRLGTETTPILGQVHDAIDLEWDFYQVEGGGHFLASPERADALAPGAAQVGETRNIEMGIGRGMDAVDGGLRRLFLPRSGEVKELQDSPDDVLTGDRVVRPLRAGATHIFQEHDKTEFMRMAPQTWTPSIRFVTVTHGTRSGIYQQIGKLIFFQIVINWTGLDTTDTSSLDISLPVAPDTSLAVVGNVNQRLSTGINMSTLTAPFLDITSGPGLGITHNRTNRVAYNTASIFSASGVIYISGHYYAA